MKTEKKKELENDNKKTANDVQISQDNDTIADMKIDDLNKNNNENKDEFRISVIYCPRCGQKLVGFNSTLDKEV